GSLSQRALQDREVLVLDGFQIGLHLAGPKIGGGFSDGPVLGREVLGSKHVRWSVQQERASEGSGHVEGNTSGPLNRAAMLEFMKCLPVLLSMVPLGAALLWGQAADPVVLTVGSEKITQSMFQEIISSLPPQQQAQLNTPEARRSLAEQVAE